MLCKQQNINNIFGGYTEAEWDSKNSHPKYDGNAFIFSITSNIKITSKKYETSIECTPGFGPIFGFGGDLTINNKFFSSSSNNMWSEQKTYFDKEYTIVKGEKNFKLNELEVYLINF